MSQHMPKPPIMYNDVITKEDYKIYGFNPNHVDSTKKRLNFLNFLINKNIYIEKRGPGKYRSISPMPQSPSFQGPSRFETSIEEKYLTRKCKSHKISEEQKEKIKDRIKQNKFFFRDMKISKLLRENQSVLKMNHAKKVKALKLEKYRHTKSIRIEKIIDKERKSKIILNKFLSQEMKKSWILLFCCVNAASALQNIYISRSNFKKRVEKTYNFYYFCTKFIGKMLVLKKRIKRKKAIKCIKIFLLPKVKFFLKNLKNTYTKQVSSTFKRISSEYFISSLQHLWRCKIIFIQRNIRNFLKCRYAKYLSFIILWQRVYYQMYRCDEDYKKKVPFLTQVYFLQGYFNKSIKEYIKTAYQKTFLTSENDENHENGNLVERKIKTFKLFTKKQEFKEFLIDAHSLKNTWEKINMKEYAYYRQYTMHPIENYLKTTRFRKEHSKKRSVIKLLKQYIY